MHQSRMDRHGDTSVRMKPANGEALAEFHRLRAIATNDCVLWTFSCDTRGYGQLRFERRVRKVHQLALELASTPAPLGMVACHQPGIGCSRHCMNVRHVYWGTQAQNMADMVVDGRSQRGSRVKGSKLTTVQVREIRARYAAGGIFARELAPEYGVTAGSISDIVRRSRWAWLD